MILLTTQQAAEYLGGVNSPLSPRTLERWRIEGKGPDPIKIGRLVRYDQAVLDAWLKTQTRSNTSQRGR